MPVPVLLVACSARASLAVPRAIGVMSLWRLSRGRPGGPLLRRAYAGRPEDEVTVSVQGQFPGCGCKAKKDRDRHGEHRQPQSAELRAVRLAWRRFAGRVADSAGCGGGSAGHVRCCAVRRTLAAPLTVSRAGPLELSSAMLCAGGFPRYRRPPGLAQPAFPSGPIAVPRRPIRRPGVARRALPVFAALSRRPDGQHLAESGSPAGPAAEPGKGQQARSAVRPGGGAPRGRGHRGPVSCPACTCGRDWPGAGRARTPAQW